MLKYRSRKTGIKKKLLQFLVTGLYSADVSLSSGPEIIQITLEELIPRCPLDPIEKDSKSIGIKVFQKYISDSSLFPI